jgi:hypothetical protein
MNMRAYRQLCLDQTHSKEGLVIKQGRGSDDEGALIKEKAKIKSIFMGNHPIAYQSN